MLLQILFASAIAVAMPMKKHGFEIASTLDYTRGIKTLNLKSTMVVESGVRTWTTLIPAHDGVLLVGRIVKAEGPTVEMEYLVIDTTKPETVVSNPSMILNQKERGEITVAAKSGTISVGTEIHSVTR